jgi:Mitochondrial carrier protein
MIKKRHTIPQELDELEDVCVNQDSFETREDDDSDSSSTTAPEEESSESSTTSTTSTSTSSISYWQTWIRTLPREIRNLLAGGLAGMAAKSVVAPLDRIKILYQVSNVPFHLTSIPNVMRRIVKTEGFGALWKGNFATMMRVFPYSGIQFMTYDRIKTHFLLTKNDKRQTTTTNNNKYGLTSIESLIAGMTAGMFSVLCTYPLDLTRAQLAVLKKHKPSVGDHHHHHHHQGTWDILKDNYTKRGFQGLFRGISPTIIGILPYSGIAFTLNEQGKREIIHVTGRDLTTIERMICGAVAGLVAQTLTYPIEVTRRRMQTVEIMGKDTAFDSLVTASTKEPCPLKGIPNIRISLSQQQLPPPPTIMNTIRHLYLEQGIRGFYKGVLMNWMKGPVAFSISFTAYDTMQALFLSKEERAHRLPLRKRLTQPSA